MSSSAQSSIECLIRTHNAIVKNANGVLPLSAELTICQDIANTLVEACGKNILENLER